MPKENFVSPVDFNLETLLLDKEVYPLRVPIFKMIEVDSVNIKSIGYDLEVKTMYVEFKPAKTTYKYLLISPELFICFLNSDSKGSFFANNIKNRYVSEKVVMTSNG
jgi:hypothetical protein